MIKYYLILIALASSLMAKAQSNNAIPHTQTAFNCGVNDSDLQRLCLTIARDIWSDEFNEKLTDQFLSILGIDKNDPDLVTKAQAAWLAKRKCLKCTSDAFDYETGDSYLPYTKFIS